MEDSADPRAASKPAFESLWPIIVMAQTVSPGGPQTGASPVRVLDTRIDVRGRGKGFGSHGRNAGVGSTDADISSTDGSVSPGCNAGKVDHPP